MGKDYNLSEIAKEYATKNQCGLPLTPEQLLNSVVAYVNEEVKSVEKNDFPFTTIGNESVFTARLDSYENNIITSEYTSNINGKKFTMKQPFGARANGGLSVDVDEVGNTLEVGIDMTGSDNDYVLTSANGKPTWKQFKNNKKYYAHYMTWYIEDGMSGRVYCTLIADNPYNGGVSGYLQLLQINGFNDSTGLRLQATGYSRNKVAVGIRVRGDSSLSVEYFNPATNSIDRVDYSATAIGVDSRVISIN